MLEILQKKVWPENIKRLLERRGRRREYNIKTNVKNVRDFVKENSPGLR